MNEEAKKAFEQIKANVLDRSLFESERPAFMKNLLPKMAPDFDRDNFYYFGSNYGNESIILCFRPETEYFDVPLKTLDPLYLSLIETAASIKGTKAFKAGSIKTTYPICLPQGHCRTAFKRPRHCWSNRTGNGQQI